MKTINLFILLSTLLLRDGFSQSQLLTSQQLDTVKKYTSLAEALQEPDKVYKLSLTYRGMTQLPTEIVKLQKLQILWLAGNDLETLPPYISKLSNLQELYMEDNFLTSLPPQIGDLVNLHTLWLIDNELTELPREMEHLTKLRDLDLRGNPFSESEQRLTRGMMPKLTQVSFIYKPILLTDAELEQIEPHLSINDAILEPESVIILDLSEKHLDSLPPILFTFPNLQVLNLWHNNLTTLPDNIINLQSLQILKIGNNNLQNLPYEISLLPNLRKLDISQNSSLTFLPHGVCMSASLVELDAPKCAIDTIYGTINNMQNLYYLNIHGNKISHFPTEFTQLSSLRILQIGKNEGMNLTLVFQTLQNLPQLEELSLSESRIINLPDEICNLTQLKALDLTFNPMSSNKIRKYAICLPQTDIIY